MMTAAGRLFLDACRIGQLDLSLPWGGRSPRVLTKAYEEYTLRCVATPLDEWLDDEELDEQCRRHHYGS